MHKPLGENACVAVECRREVRRLLRTTPRTLSHTTADDDRPTFRRPLIHSDWQPRFGCQVPPPSRVPR